MRPIVWTRLKNYVPYKEGLRLQESIVRTRLDAKKLVKEGSGDEKTRAIADTDVLLLLEHAPVYTGGRRLKDDSAEVREERDRLLQLGADFELVLRGGEITYHGPGQLVGYSLMDLEASKLSARCYVDKMERFLKTLPGQFGVPTVPLEHTGAFVSETEKIGSIGVHIRHRITLHGFSLNVTNEPLAWFNQVVACGLPDVHAISLNGRRDVPLAVDDIVPPVATEFASAYGRDLVSLADFGGKRHLQYLKELIDGLDTMTAVPSAPVGSRVA